MRQLFFVILWVGLFGLSLTQVEAQQELAATLEVLDEGVEVLRFNTSNWIPIRVEAIVGVGDRIRTDATGQARVTFFADGVETDLLPNTEYQINQFTGDGESFQLEVSVLVGQTVQRINRLLDANSTYDVRTPSMALAARGTEFVVRVQDAGRSAMLVSQGVVAATAEELERAVDPGFGIRADDQTGLSDVVRADSFDALDASLDGCAGSVRTTDDVSVNIRLGASTDFPIVGVVLPQTIDRLMGQAEDSDWYRIRFRGGFGWILSSTAQIEEECAGLREFPASYGPEDVEQYAFVGNPMELDDLLNSPMPEATQAP